MTTTSPALIRARLDGREAVLLRVEDARGAAGVQPLVPGELDDGAVRREVAAQNRKPAGRSFSGVPLRRSPPGPAASTAAAPTSARVEPATLHGDAVEQLAAHELARQQRHAAGVGAGRSRRSGRPASGRRSPASPRRSRRTPRAAARAPSSSAIASRCSTRVGRAAGRRDRGDRVLECRVGQDLRRPPVLADEVHDEPPGLPAACGLAGRRRRDAALHRRAEPEKVERDRHRVRGELTAARTGSGARDALELVQLGGGPSFQRHAAPTPSKTSWIVTSRPRKRPGAIEPP